MQTNWHSNSNSNSRSSSNRRTTGDTSSLSHEELRMPSTLPNYSEKIAKKMAKTFQHHGRVVPFETFILSDLFYVYLFRKYKMDCNVQLIYIDIKAFITQLVYVLNSIIKYENIGQPENKMQKITLTRAHDVCPDMRGLQVLEEASKLPRLSIEPSGYCMLWSMFFTELCLKNP